MNTKANQPLAKYLAISKAGLLGLALATVPTALATGTVSNLNDSGPGSLRQAIADASPGDTINIEASGTIALTSGQITINKSLTIVGPGAKILTVSGNNASRVFNLPNASDAVTITDLAVAYGNAGAGDGGGIWNNASLTLMRCSLLDNAASAGGGIMNWGPCTITECTIADNSATNNDGGGINNLDSMNVVSSTISSNQTPFYGGAVKVSSVGANTQFTSCTITGNAAGLGSGGLWAEGTVKLRNCILANNVAPQNVDGQGTIESLDYNLIGNTAGLLVVGTTAHNIYNLDPKLGPLADLGGPTPTHALRFDSPAIDAGHSDGLSADQRGFPRPLDAPDVANAAGGDACDIGAYEMNPNMEAQIYTAVEFAFGTVLGQGYRIESSTDLLAWESEEEDIAGTGGKITRFYTVRAYPKKFFRAVRE